MFAYQSTFFRASCRQAGSRLSSRSSTTATGSYGLRTNLQSGWSMRGQSASFSTGGAGASGQGPQQDWIATVLNTGNSIGAFESAAFYHPDDEKKERDLRDMFPDPVSPDEILELTDRLDMRLLYAGAELPESALDDCKQLIQTLREYAIAREKSVPISFNQYHNLGQKLLAFAFIYHNRPLGPFIISDKDASTLWRIWETPCRIEAIVQANLTLRAIIHLNNINVRWEVEQHDSGWSLSRSQHLIGKSGLAPDQVAHATFNIVTGLGYAQYLEEAWFKEEDERHILELVARMRKIVNSADKSFEKKIFSRINIADAEQFEIQGMLRVYWVAGTK